MLCSGVFIIIATLLRCILSLQSINGINVSTIWAIRETVSHGHKMIEIDANSLQFVGIIATNAAAIKPLFSTSRWLSSSKGNSTPYTNDNNSHPLATIGGSSNMTPRPKRRRSMDYTDIDNSSEENIFKPDLSHLRGETKVTSEPNARKGLPGHPITVTTQVDVDYSRQV